MAARRPRSVLMNAPVLMMMMVILEISRSGALARPASYDEYLAVEGDMVTVGSLRREVRQPAPQRIATEVSDLLSSSNAPKKSHDKKHVKNASGKSDEGGFYKAFGSDADGEKGYLKKTFTKGDHGYKTLDTFHKQLGDRYGFEEHEAFGKESGDDKQKHHGKSAKHTSKHSDAVDDHEGAGTDDVSHYAEGEGDSSDYSEGGGDGEHYSGDGGDTSSYNDGETEGYSESYASGDGGEGGEHGSYSSGDSSSAEEGDGESYY